jgi:hypothetical protein
MAQIILDSVPSMDRLAEMKFKLIPKVNSVKSAQFVRKIEEWKKSKEVIPQ